MSGLLASVVATSGLQPEPVATEALVHLCNRSRGARRAVAALLQDIDPDLMAGDLMFTGQMTDSTSGGRPDVVASDAHGVRLVLEAKFDAELTDAQSSTGYVDLLSPAASGAMVFLVPADRLANVWRQVCSGPGGQEVHANPTAQAIDHGLLRLKVTPNRALAAITWDNFLNRLTTSLEADDHEAAADLEQIKGLVTWRSRAGWTPVLPGDLPQRTGRQLRALADALRHACSDASHDKIKNGTTDGGPGRYLTTGTGKRFWAGVHLGYWGDVGPGPVWAHIALKDLGQQALLSPALTAAGIQSHPRPGRNDVLVPLHVQSGYELARVTESLTEQLMAIVDVIDAQDVDVIDESALGAAATAEVGEQALINDDLAG